jgi:hypothetical protein
MKKLLVIPVFLMFSLIGARAQDGGFSFGAGLNLALPIGDFSETHSFGVGVEAQGEYMFSEMFGAVFNTGYTQFMGKEVVILGTTVEYDGIGLIPVMAGVRVYPSSQFFIGARAGLGVFTGNDNSSTGFAYRPEVGATLGPVQIAASYNGWSKDGGSLAHIGLSIIYRFGSAAE